MYIDWHNLSSNYNLFVRTWHNLNKRAVMRVKMFCIMPDLLMKWLNTHIAIVVRIIHVRFEVRAQLMVEDIGRPEDMAEPLSYQSCWNFDSSICPVIFHWGICNLNWIKRLGKHIWRIGVQNIFGRGYSEMPHNFDLNCPFILYEYNQNDLIDYSWCIKMHFCG